MRNIMNVFVFTLMVLGFNITICAQTLLLSDHLDSILNVLDSKFEIKHTPIPYFVSGVNKTTLSLNGDWLFNPNPEPQFENKHLVKNVDGWKSMYVPSEWYMNSFIVEKGKWAGYYKEFSIPDDWRKKKVIIRFGAVNSECKLYINGNYVGYHIGTMNQFEFDITPFLKENVNSLALYVRSESIADEIGHISYYAHHQVGGILRRVDLIALPTSYISDVYCDAMLSSDLKTGHLSVQFDVELSKNLNISDLNIEVILKKKGIEGLISDNGIVDQVKTQLNDDKDKWQVDITVFKPNLWHAESPYLYETEINLYEKGQKIETVKKNIGFRKIEIKGNVLLVNGSPVKLRGTAFHDIDPYNGRAIRDTSEIRKDIELYRAANCNYLRTSHYPKDEYFLDLCDRYGIFVENEAPACWVGVPWVTPLTEPEKAKEQIFYNFKSLIMRDRNHPSMLIWSLANESMWSDDFLLCYKLSKKMTPQILVKFSHSEYWGIDNPMDIGSRHYPGWEGLIKYDNHFRPIVFDEAVHVNTYNTSEIVTDPGLRDLWGEYIKYFVENMQNTSAVTGLAVWSGNDEMFYPLDRAPVGYGPLGIIDGFRREKPEYWHMKMAYSPIRIVSKTFQDVNGKTVIWVDNNYNVNDLNRVEFTWYDGKATGKITLNGQAGKQHTLVIPHKMQGDTLKISVSDRRGFVISEWEVPRNKKLYLMPTMDYCERVTSLVSEDTLIVKAKNIIYQFSLSSGQLLSIMKDKVQLVKDGIQMYLIPHSPSNEVIDFIPLKSNNSDIKFLSEPLQGWKCDSVDTCLDERKAQITFWGKYDSIPMKFSYKINGDGHLRLDYIANLRNVQVQNIRQIGVGFNLPKDFDKLSWVREALWSVYPSDHIGRQVGKTKAFFPETLVDVYSQRKIPKHSFARDGNSYGSNDFRSTKHNIYKAVLKNDSLGVEIESNGKQHFRSWVMPHCISFILANYSNGGNESYLSFDSNRTKISSSEFKKDGSDFAGWLQINFDK